MVQPPLEAGAEPLDRLVVRLLGRYPFRFSVATGDEERNVAYRLRHAAVVEQGWAAGGSPDALEHDEYDASAVIVVGWDGATPVSTGRLVLPPGPLPTEEACGLVVRPRGEVVDVGRMVVRRSHQTVDHGAFIALLCRLYLEMRAGGHRVACGMMATNARALMRHLGLMVEVLGDERDHCGERRAPVRFEVARNTASATRRWRPSDG